MTEHRAFAAVLLGGAYLAYKVWKQSKEVFELKAREQMKEFAALYTRGLDRLDPDLIKAAFVEGGMMDIPNLEKPVPVAQFCIGATDFLKKSLVASMHAVSNFHVVFASDMKSAKSSIYFVANHFKVIDGAVVNAAVYGRYCDTWVNDRGVFKITYRKLIYDFQGTEWTKAIEAAKKDTSLKQLPGVARHENLGVRDKSDYDYAHLSWLPDVAV
ncbi:hypothetical protein CTAYLR_003191 [Chrysophaeum taylorii]|uniref:SnoaL-like domain-containing protein n=1 Tax=Chrysophaeum taylorii TaxID=2483200 RepID=A0AAD7UBG2_9STRA|nr:hypothetical protein CTAYLR_003191 [Chrysophaeum taylorii]